MKIFPDGQFLPDDPRKYIFPARYNVQKISYLQRATDLAQGLLPMGRRNARILNLYRFQGTKVVVNESNILNSILEIPVKPELSFQVSHLERNSGEQFDRVLQARVDTPHNESPPASPRSFEAKERPGHSEHPTPVTKNEPPRPAYTENRPSDSHPVTSDSQQRSPAPLQNNETLSHSGEPASREPVNPFALPLEQLARDINSIDNAPGLVDHANTSAVDALAGLFENHGLNAEGSPAIDTLKELLAGLNIDSETINQLVEALNNGDAAGVQGILNALRGLLQATQQVAQSPAAGVIAEVAGNRLHPPEQRALDLLARAGLTQEEAQQVIQQVRAGNTTQSATDNTSQLSKTAVDAVASKLNSENSTGSGNLQNGDSSGSSKNSSEGPRNFAGLAGEKLESLASVMAPDKAGNAQTNPLIAKPSASPLLNTSGQPVPGALAEGTQAPAAVADAAAKGVEFVKPAVTETYNGRASMDKPITAQIIEKFSLRGIGNQREVHIKLDPPSLGTVRMNVSTSGESVRATIVAENSVVKSIIENNLTQLKDAITHQGVKIENFNVLVGGNASHSAEGHQAALDYLGQLGQEGLMAHEQAEEIVTFHRSVFFNENQSFSIFA